MSDAERSEFEQAACAVAREAGAVLLRRFRGRLEVEAKGLHDFVTDADREAEATILEFLRRRFPEHDIMSEEASPEAARSTYRWIVDPLDGTTNFMHGVLPFGVSVGLEDADGIVAAAIYDPGHDELFHARRGGGARCNGETIRCSEVSELGLALVATGFPFRELSRLRPYLRSFEALVRSTTGIRRAGAASIDLAYTACGRYDGFWEVGLSPWDVAAGMLIVTEAGGRVTDVAGGQSTLSSGDIVAAGRPLHPLMLEIVTAAFGD